MFRQQRLRSAPARILAALFLLLATNLGLGGVSALAAAPGCDRTPNFERHQFSNPTRIDNQYLPLVPGTQFTLEGRANRGGGPLPHRVVFTVTDLTKVIDGVRSRVMWDVDINENVLVESELAFFAQDDRGDVWNTGEYPEEYEGGTFTGAPNTWITGVDRARAGVHMWARPRIDARTYLQGFSPTIDFLDCGRVVEKNQHVSVPAGNYDNVLVTDENSPLDPGRAVQRKFYAPGVGNVQIAAVDDPEGETLVLVKVERLKPHALAQVRREALKLDRHAYKVSDVYRHTPPAE